MREIMIRNSRRWSHTREFTSGLVNDDTYAKELSKVSEILNEMQRDTLGARWGISRRMRGLGLGPLRGSAYAIVKILDVLEGVDKKPKGRRKKSAKPSAAAA